MKSKDLVIVGGLLLLNFIPAVGGVARLGEISAGAVTPENARFLSQPLPAILHIAGASIYGFLGAIQFAPGLRARWPHWHREAGKVSVLAGVTVASTGLWMTCFYSRAGFDGPLVAVARVVVGFLMLFFIGRGLDAIRRRRYLEHGDWMLRAYALALGAGTQVFTHVPWFLFPSIQGETARFVFMAAGWIVNAIAAEKLISRKVCVPEV